MGVELKCKCRYCGHQFIFYYGYGFNGAGEKCCSRCGKKRKYSILRSENRLEYFKDIQIPCECGGQFEDEARGTCRACGAVLSKLGIDYDEEFYCMWD